MNVKRFVMRYVTDEEKKLMNQIMQKDASQSG